MAEDYDPFSAAEDAYDPFAAADAPAPAPPPVAIDASQIAAALAQDAAQLRGELESKTKQAVEMQKKRDAETAARKAQEQAAAAARAAERRARVLGSTELTPEGVSRCIEAAICAVLRWPPPGGLARWTVAALTPWLDAPAAEVQQRIAGVDAHELEELLDVRARLARAPDAARRLTAAPSKRRRGGWDAAASARRRHTEPGSFREAAAGRTVAEFVGSRKRFRLVEGGVVASSRSPSPSSSSSSSSGRRRSRSRSPRRRLQSPRNHSRSRSRSPRRRRESPPPRRNRSRSPRRSPRRSRSRSPPRRSRYDTALPRRRSRSPRRSPGKRSRSRSRPRRDTKRSRFDEPRVVSKAAAAAREAAELAALSDGALRDQWQRVVKAAVLEVLAEPPPDGAPHWRLADLTGRVGASRRALEAGIAKVAPARAAARRVLARCLGDSGRFHDISDGCGFASFARKQPYLRVVGFHADAAVHAVEVQAAEEGEADEARAPLSVGDRVRFKLPDRSVRKGVVTAIHRGGEKVSVREEATDEVHRLPATAVKRAASRSPRSSAAPDVSRPRASKFSDAPAPAPAPRRASKFSDAPAPAPTTRAPRRASKFSDAPPPRAPPPRAPPPPPRAAERRGPPASPARAHHVPPRKAPEQSHAPTPPPALPKVPERPPPRTVPVPVPAPRARTAKVPAPKPSARKKAKGTRPPRCADFEIKSFGQLMAEKKKQ